METVGWYEHAEAVASTSFLRMVRRLPHLVWRSLSVAWRASRSMTVAAIGLNLGSGAATTFGLLATRDAAAHLFAATPSWERVTAALPALAVIAVAAGLKEGLAIAAGWAQARLKPLATATVEAEFYALTCAVPASAYDEDSFADDMQRSRDRGTSASVFMVEYTIDVFTGLVGISAVAVAVAIIHPILLVLLIVAALPVAWSSIRSAKIQYLSVQSRITRARRLWLVEELMASRRTAIEVRAYGMGPWLRAQHAWMVNAENHADLDVVRRQTLTRIAGSVMAGAAGIGVYTALLILLASGQVILAAGAAAVLALQQGGSNMRLLVTSINSVYEEGMYFSDHIAFCHRASARLPQPPAGNDAEAGPPGVIELDNVGLRYPGSDRDAITGVSATIRAGQTIALVGENGSGKSSLAKLLACLYTPTSGHIRWDGIDITEHDPEELRHHIAVVAQDYGRWPFSAEANVKIGRPNQLHTHNGRTGIQAAADVAGAHDMIMDLPHQYQTLLDKMYKDGVDLSGGQWQKMTLARAVYRDAPLMLCDEPSAALDPRAEAHIFNHLKQRTQNKITVLITHRLANVRHADLILVLHKGQQTESGTHNQLITQGGQYAELFNLQASGYTKEHK